MSATGVDALVDLKSSCPAGMLSPQVSGTSNDALVWALVMELEVDMEGGRDVARTGRAGFTLGHGARCRPR